MQYIGSNIAVLRPITFNQRNNWNTTKHWTCWTTHKVIIFYGITPFRATPLSTCKVRQSTHSASICVQLLYALAISQCIIITHWSVHTIGILSQTPLYYIVLYHDRKLQKNQRMHPVTYFLFQIIIFVHKEGINYSFSIIRLLSLLPYSYCENMQYNKTCELDRTRNDVCLREFYSITMHEFTETKWARDFVSFHTRYCSR